MKTLIKSSILCVLLLTSIACGKTPPNLTPPAAAAYRANDVVIALGTLQHAAIELNRMQVCTPPPCKPGLSDHNTGVVVDSVTAALNTLKSVPTGAKATAATALTQIENGLDQAGKTKIVAYIEMAKSVISSYVEASR